MKRLLNNITALSINSPVATLAGAVWVDHDRFFKAMANIGSDHEAWGNGSHSHVLTLGFAEHMPTDVFALVQFILQKRGGKAATLGDKHNQEIAEKLKDHDYVNIQFQAGLYGATLGDILRRMKNFFAAFKNIVISMHRINIETLSLVSIIRGNWETFFDRGRFVALLYLGPVDK